MLSAARSSRIIAIIAVDGALAHERQPFGLGLAHQRRAEFARESFADGLQIVAGIEALGDRADVFAERLAVAQEGRAREHVDLRRRRR